MSVVGGMETVNGCRFVHWFESQHVGCVRYVGSRLSFTRVREIVAERAGGGDCEPRRDVLASLRASRLIQIPPRDIFVARESARDKIEPVEGRKPEVQSQIYIGVG